MALNTIEKVFNVSKYCWFRAIFMHTNKAIASNSTATTLFHASCNTCFITQPHIQRSLFLSRLKFGAIFVNFFEQKEFSLSMIILQVVHLKDLFDALTENVPLESCVESETMSKMLQQQKNQAKRRKPRQISLFSIHLLFPMFLFLFNLFDSLKITNQTPFCVYVCPIGELLFSFILFCFVVVVVTVQFHTIWFRVIYLFTSFFISFFCLFFSFFWNHLSVFFSLNLTNEEKK